MDLDNILLICLPDQENILYSSISNKLSTIIDVFKSNFINTLLDESLINLSMCNKSIFKTIINYWNITWCKTAIEGLSYIRYCRSQALKKYAGKSYHFYNDDFPRIWWTANKMTYLYHIYALQNQCVNKKYRSKPTGLIPSKILPGDCFDVKDSKNIWCGAVVLRVKYNNTKRKKKKLEHLYVRFLGWSNNWNKWVSINSWGEDIVPYGTRSLQWTNYSKVQTNQYCLIHRYQVMTSMDPSISLGSFQKTMDSFVSGYSIAIIKSIYTSPDHEKNMYEMELHVKIPGFDCNDSDDCEKNQFGECKNNSRSKRFLIRANDYELIPLNDLTSIIYLSKIIIYTTFLCFDLSEYYQDIIKKSKDRFERIIQKIGYDICPTCSVNHQYMNNFNKMNLFSYPWCKNINMIKVLGK